MKSTLALCIFLIFTVNFITLTESQAQDNKLSTPITVSDYYYRLPSKYFGGRPDSFPERKLYIIKIDQINKYLEADKIPLEQRGIGFDLKLKMYKKSDGGDILLIDHSLAPKRIYTNTGVDKAGPQIVVYLPDIVEFHNGNWLDVTFKVLPEIATQRIFEKEQLRNAQVRSENEDTIISATYQIDIPRDSIVLRGTSITYYRCAWNGRQFEIID